MNIEQYFQLSLIVNFLSLVLFKILTLLAFVHTKLFQIQENQVIVLISLSMAPITTFHGKSNKPP